MLDCFLSSPLKHVCIVCNICISIIDVLYFLQTLKNLSLQCLQDCPVIFKNADTLPHRLQLCQPLFDRRILFFGAWSFNPPFRNKILTLTIPRKATSMNRFLLPDTSIHNHFPGFLRDCDHTGRIDITEVSK